MTTTHPVYTRQVEIDFGGKTVEVCEVVGKERRNCKTLEIRRLKLRLLLAYVLVTLGFCVTAVGLMLR